MTYKFDPGKSLRANLHNVATDQIDQALETLERHGDREERVHDLRKRMKKLRGLLRLVRPGLGDHYRAENREFRDIARLFSGIRDSQVLAETLNTLAKEAGGDRLTPLTGWAARRRDMTLAEKDLPARFDEAAERLGAARHRVPGWPVAGGDRDVIRGGLKSTYGRARKAWRKAGKTPADTARLHEWRKKMKYHWYHCRLLRKAQPDAISARIEALDELSEALGDDHDLVVLSAVLGSDAAGGLPRSALRHVAELATTKSRNLRRHAFALAPQVLAEKKGKLADRLTGNRAPAPSIR